jgi:hypothetical protein
VTDSFRVRLNALCGSSRAIAANTLESLRFTAKSEGVWEGLLLAADGQSAEVVVELPEGFPHQLPIVKLVNARSHRAQAHIESSGKICIAPTHGLLVDISRPQHVIQQVLERATAVVFPQDWEAHQRDLAEEFAAYWGTPNLSSVLAVSDLPKSSCPIVVTPLLGLLELASERGLSRSNTSCRTRERPIRGLLCVDSRAHRSAAQRHSERFPAR